MSDKVKATETYPNITWEVESNKLFTGDDFSKGSASTLRSVWWGVYGMEQAIKKGECPLKRIEIMKHWLAVCLFSCNSKNFEITTNQSKKEAPCVY